MLPQEWHAMMSDSTSMYKDADSIVKNVKEKS